MNSLLLNLLKATSTTEVLTALLACAVELHIPICSIRYYRLRRLNNQDHLVSVDCAGHDTRTATQLRLGRIVRTRHKQGEARLHRSFTVIDDSATGFVAFQIDPSLTVPIHKLEVGSIPFWLLNGDRCDSILGDGATRAAWIEMPLILSAKPVGKLCCSLTCGRLDPAHGVSKPLLASLKSFRELATLSAPYLESLCALDRDSPLEEAGRAILSCQSYPALYRYCTHVLRRITPFDYEAADMLVVSRDTIKHYESKDGNDSELLILRASTYSVANKRRWVNRKSYRKHIRPRLWLVGDEAAEGGQGLTPWVWRERQPLYLSYDPIDPEFEKQLRAFEPDPAKLAWKKWILADSSPRSLLIVPIFAPQTGHYRRDRKQAATMAPRRRVIGVIRFVNQKQDAPISPREVVLLQRIAERCIGPRLMELRHEITSETIAYQSEKTNIMTLAAFRDPNDSSPKSLQDILREVFDFILPKGGRRVILLNLLNPATPGVFRPIVIDGNLPNIAFYDQFFPFRGSLTNYVVNTSKRPFVFVNDIRYAITAGCFAPPPGNPDNIKCALASPIRFQTASFGALVILSDRYDILPGAYGRILHVLATQLGVLFARREVLDFASCIHGLWHDGRSAFAGIRNCLEVLNAVSSVLA